jgi:UTP:GlnB (protein PII) uridylyltransferase
VGYQYPEQRHGGNMKKVTMGAVLIIAAVYICQEAQAQTFSWDLRFMQGQKRESVSVSRTVRMETGEEFLIAIKPDTTSYCYVLCYDSEHQIYVLKNEIVTGGSEVYLDPIEITDPPGTETVYVIMSLERQTKLESLIQTYNKSSTQQNANDLYREVVSMQNAVSALGEAAPSFIPSGGTTRGSSEEYINHFSGKSIYVRPIIIRH